MIWYAVQVAKDAGVTVCFDPNVRLNLWSKAHAAKSLEKFFRAADIVLPGLEDMEMLFGDTTMEQACARLVGMGCKRFVLKNAHQNVLAYDQGQATDFPVAGIANPVDLMGAGDAFAAGFIAGMAGGRSFADAVRYAITVAGISVQMPGNIESLPTSAEVERAISGARKWNR
jgi:2-dehydro-3-deoxygluconokinase